MNQTRNQYEALLFDFDYTLADSSKGIVESMNYAFNCMGLPPVSSAEICRTIGLSLSDALAVLQGEEYRVRTGEFTNLFVSRADQIMADMTVIYKDVPETLELLKSRGYRLGIVSTKYRYRIEWILERAHLLHYFDVIIGGEDVSSHKPDPQGLLKAVEKLRVQKSRVLYVGDSVTDAETAARAGISFAAVLTGETPAGAFDHHTTIAVFQCLHDLPEFLATSAPDWWAEWFNEEYLQVYPHRNRQNAEGESRAAIDWVGLQPQDRVLDLCGGTGRHTSWLIDAGIRHVTGLDYSETMLNTARRRLGKDAVLVRGDMRDLPFMSCVDAVLMFFTSFGYFVTDRENERVIHEISRVLRPGGGFLFDYLNREKIIRELESETVRTLGETAIRETRYLVENGKRVFKEIVITCNGETHRYSESVRLYSLEELMCMFEAAKLMPERLYGDFDGTPYTSASSRLILVSAVRR
ncbi:MAG TPA: HAD-IA family hydrolase [bacterium]|nr:HAD-IA family hydrolase [bacterium]HQL61628.1 HAD-IA family hydrolase [bacterium]